MMALLPLTGELDSRTSSIGRKRNLSHFGDVENNLVGHEEPSSGEEDGQHLDKRFRNNEIVQRDSPPHSSIPTASTDFRDAITIDDSPEPVMANLRHRPTEVLSGSPTIDSNTVQTGEAGQSRLPWNKGIPVETWTSFGARVSGTEVTPKQLTSAFHMALPQFGSKREAATNARLGTKIAATEVANPSKRKLKKLFDWSKVDTLLLQSFGSNAQREEAKRIINTLPEVSRTLMPQDTQRVPDNALIFVTRGQKFKFPRQLHRDYTRSALPRLNFHGAKFSFVARFLQENSSSLDSIDYEFLVQSFQDYLKLLYGHLPEKLVQMVGSAKRVTSEKMRRICVDAIEEAKESTVAADFNGAQKVTKLKPQQPRLPKTLPESPAEVQSNEVWRYKHKDTYFMGRMLGTKRTQSLQAKSAQVESKNKSLILPVVADSSEGVDTPGAAAMLLDVQASPQASPQAPNASNRTEIEQNLADADPLEIELWNRYFPSDGKDRQICRCLTCAEIGHKTSDCPLLTCATCGARGIHFTYACPQTVRCMKCHERGHHKSECPEKLAATPGENVGCDICNSKNHTLQACHFLWRSFKPELLKNVRRVSHIPISCSSCGASGHFGPECGIYCGALLTEGYTWSKSNLSRYIDPKSSNRAIHAGRDYTIPVSTKPKKNFAIRGRAQNAPILVSDDESDDVSFIGQRIKKQSHPIPKGNMHFKFDSLSRKEDHYGHQFQSVRAPSGPRHPQAYLAHPSADRYPRYDDKRPQSYRPPEDSACHRRGPSFSPSRFQDDRYLPRRDDASQYRPYERDHAAFNHRPSPPQGPQASRNDGPRRSGSAMRGRNGKPKLQRNCKK